MTYSQLDLPRGGSLYITELSSALTPSLSTYRSLTQALLHEVAPRGTAWQIAHDDSGAPFLISANGAPLEGYSISVSHSGAFVALAIRQLTVKHPQRIGIDLQVASDKLALVASRFMSPLELDYYQRLTESADDPSAREWLYTVWGLKEAAYKAYPLRVKRCLATNFIIVPPQADASNICYRIYADDGGDVPSLLEGYQLHSILDSPYHLTFVSRSSE